MGCAVKMTKNRITSRILIKADFNYKWLWDELKIPNAVQCGNCGSILVDTKFAVESLKKWRDKNIDYSKNDYDELVEEFTGELMRVLESGVY